MLEEKLYDMYCGLGEVWVRSVRVREFREFKLLTDVPFHFFLVLDNPVGFCDMMGELCLDDRREIVSDVFAGSSFLTFFLDQVVRFSGEAVFARLLLLLEDFMGLFIWDKDTEEIVGSRLCDLKQIVGEEYGVYYPTVTWVDQWIDGGFNDLPRYCHVNGNGLGISVYSLRFLVHVPKLIVVLNRGLARVKMIEMCAGGVLPFPVAGGQVGMIDTIIGFI